MTTVYLHTLGFMQAVGFYTFKNISTSRTTSPAALAQHHKSVSSSKAFFWLLNAVKNRGLNAETCFLKHKKAKYAFVSLQVRSLYLLFGNFVIHFVEEKMSWAHLAKQSSDLKQNVTQEKTPFSGLSHGVLRFVASVSFKNH